MKSLQKMHDASTLVYAVAFLSVDCGFKRQARRAFLDRFAIESFPTSTVCKNSTDLCRGDFIMRLFVCAGVVK